MNLSVIDVVIVNWNSGRLVKECIDSVLLHGSGRVGKIVVVDNGSIDASLAGLPSDQRVTVVRAGENLGFARACNLGAAGSGAKFLLFLNPDAKIRSGTLDKVCEFMDSVDARDVGICGVKLVDDRGSVQRHCSRFPKWSTYIGMSLGLTAVLPRYFPPLFMRDFDHLTSRRVDHVMGAFFCVRSGLFRKMHGFDERFFVYFEDLDFSLRAEKMGWHSHYLADGTAYHKGGGVSEQVKANRLFYSLRSRILYAFKHFRRSEAWAVVLAALLLEPIPRTVRAVFRGSFPEVLDTWRGYSMLWKNAPAFIRQALQ